MPGFEFPNQHAMLEHFFVEPVRIDETTFYYQLTDVFGVYLKLSFDVVMRSVRIIFWQDDRLLLDIYHEEAYALKIRICKEENEFKGHPFVLGEFASGELHLFVFPHLSVQLREYGDDIYGD